MLLTTTFYVGVAQYFGSVQWFGTLLIVTTLTPGKNLFVVELFFVLARDVFKSNQIKRNYC